MGKVWFDSVQIGTFEPQTQGTSGDVYVGTTDVGDFTLAANGYVYLNGTQIGTYVATTELITSRDPRFQTKIWLDDYLSPSAITKDDGSPALFAVIYAKPNYPIKLEFRATSNPVDLIFCIDTPNSVALPIGVGYIENMPITIWTIDKTGITGTKLRWKAEAELRRIVETHAVGYSLWTLDRLSDNEQNLGSTILYSVEYVLRYKRYVP